MAELRRSLYNTNPYSQYAASARPQGSIPDADQPNEFQKGVNRGTDQMQAGLYGAAEVAGELVNSDTLRRFGREGYERNIQEASDPRMAARVPSIYDATGLRDYVDWAAGGLGTIVPYAAATLAGAVVGGTMGRAIIPANRGLGAKLGAGAGVVGTSAPIETGSIYKENEEESGIRDPYNALAFGTASGALNVVGPAAVFNRLARPGPSLLSNIGRTAGTGAAAEGITETAQEGLNIAARANVDPNFDPLGADAPEVTERLVNAAALGTLGGGVMGSLGGIARPTQRSRDNIFAEPSEGPAASLSPQDEESDSYQLGNVALENYAAGLISEDQFFEQMDMIFDTVGGSESIAVNIGMRKAEIDNLIAQEPTARDQFYFGEQPTDDLNLDDSLDDAPGVDYESGLNEINTREDFVPDLYFDPTGLPFVTGIERAQDRAMELDAYDPETEFGVDTAYNAMRDRFAAEGMSNEDIQTELQRLGRVYQREQQRTYPNREIPQDPIEYLQNTYVVRSTGRVAPQLRPQGVELSQRQLEGEGLSSGDIIKRRNLQRRIKETTDETVKKALRDQVKQIDYKRGRGGILQHRSRTSTNPRTIDVRTPDGKERTAYLPRLVRIMLQDVESEGSTRGKQTDRTPRFEEIRRAFLQGMASLQLSGVELDGRVNGSTIAYSENGRDYTVRELSLKNPVLRARERLRVAERALDVAKRKNYDTPEARAEAIQRAETNYNNAVQEAQRAQPRSYGQPRPYSYQEERPQYQGEGIEWMNTEREMTPLNQATVGGTYTIPVQQTDEGANVFRSTEDREESPLSPKAQEDIRKLVRLRNKMPTVSDEEAIRMAKKELGIPKDFPLTEADALQEISSRIHSIRTTDQRESTFRPDFQPRTSLLPKYDDPARSASMEATEALPRMTLSELRSLDDATHVSQVKKMTQDVLKGLDVDVKLNVLTTKQALDYASQNNLPEYVAQLENGSLHGFTTGYSNGEISIFIHPSLEGDLRREILAHELGHVVFRSAASNMSSKTAEAIVKDFYLWAERYSRGTADALLRSKKTPKAAILAAINGLDGRNVSDLDSATQDYLLDFEEWFADNISKWIEDTTQTADTPVGQFFKRIATLLKSIAGRLRIPTFAVYGYADSIVTDREAFANMFSSSNAAIFSAAYNAIKRPFSNDAITGISYTIDELVDTPTRDAIQRAVNTSSISNQLSKYADAVARTDFPALAFSLWRAGKLRAGPSLQAAFEKLQSTYDQSLKSSSVRELPIRPAPSLSVGEQLGPSDRSATVQRAGEGSSKVMGGLKKFFFIPDERLRATKIPALRELANMLHVKAGERNVNPTYFEDRQKRVASFTNKLGRFYRNLSKEEGQQVLDVLINPKLLNHADPKIERAARQTFQLMGEVRDYMVDSGVTVGKRGDQYFPWVFDPEKFANQMDSQKWYDFLTQPHLKPSLEAELELVNAAREKAEMPTIDLKTFVGQLANSIIDSYGVAEGDVQMDIDPLPSMRSTNRRFLDFVRTNGNAADMATIRSLMSDDIGLVATQYIQQAVKRSEYSRRFGEDGSKLRSLLAKAERQGARPEDLELAKEYVDAAMGVHGIKTARWLHDKFGLGVPSGRPINPGLQKTMGWMMVYQNIRLLGLATLTSLVDPMGIGVRTGDISTAFWGMKEAFKSALSKDPTVHRDLAEMLGIIDYDVINDALGWEYGGVYMSGTARKLNEGFFRFTGLSAWTRTTRIAGTAAATKFIAKHAQGKHRDSKRYLEELNLTAEDVLLNPDGSLKILTYYERKQADPAEVARDEKVRNAVVRFVDESILRPNAAQRPLWASDPHYMLVFHLKSFMYSFHDRILKRVALELGKGNFGHLAGLLMYVPLMIAADALRDLIQHGGEGSPSKQNWGAMDYVVNGVIRSGIPGVPGLTAYDIYKDYEYGGIPGSSLAGPTVEQLTDFELDKAYPLQTLNLF